MTLKIRPFKDSDAETVFRLRASAFETQFLEELGPEKVADGVNAYSPADYCDMAKDMKFFIAEENDTPIAFYTIKLDNPETAELLFIYIDTNSLGLGIGTQLIQHSEDWIRANWPSVKTYIVDTAIPKYNGNFYRKMGFVDAGKSKMPYPGEEAEALRLTKQI